MRFYDYLSDVRETSERNSKRRAPVSVDVSVRMTLKTLARQDVYDFFFQLSDEYGADASEFCRLLFGIYCYAFLANANPRPNAEYLIKFSKHVFDKIKKIDQNFRDCVDIYPSRKSIIPKSLSKKISSIVGNVVFSNFRAIYCGGGVSRERIKNLITDFKNECLVILYIDKFSIDFIYNNYSNRILYDDVVFHFNDFNINCLYISNEI